MGLVTGLVESLGHVVQGRFLHKMLPAVLHPHAPWMTLVDDLVLFAVPGAVFALAVWCWPRARLDRLASAGFTVLLLYALGDLVAVKEWPAAVALSIGLAAVAARKAEPLERLARRTIWPVAAGAAIFATGFLGASWASEARARASLPPAGPGAPNVLLITLDTVRAASLSLYGYDRPTSPSLERLARRGVCFDQAIAPSSWTLTSHASLFTGHFPRELFQSVPYLFVQGADAPMDDRFPTLAEFLDRQGYRTAAFIANTIFCDRVYRLDRGFGHYDDYKLCLQQVIKTAHLSYKLTDWLVRAKGDRVVLARKSGADINREFLRWLNGVQGRPFFAFLNYMDAHDPYDPPPEFMGRFGSQGSRPGMRMPEIRSAASLRDDYDCCLASLDHQIGLLFDELERRGLLDNTLVILTSDHGELIGEHDRFGHGEMLYMPVIHVPLVVIYPGKVPGGKRVPLPVSLREVPATVCDLTGLKAGSSFPGASLRRFWQGAGVEPVSCQVDVKAVQGAPLPRPMRLRSLVDGRFHYIEGTHLEVRLLYDLQRDRAEEQELLRQGEGVDVAARCHAYLEQQERSMEAQDRPRP